MTVTNYNSSNASTASQSAGRSAALNSTKNQQQNLNLKNRVTPRKTFLQENGVFSRMFFRFVPRIHKKAALKDSSDHDGGTTTSGLKKTDFPLLNGMPEDTQDLVFGMCEEMSSTKSSDPNSNSTLNLRSNRNSSKSSVFPALKRVFFNPLMLYFLYGMIEFALKQLFEQYLLAVVIEPFSDNSTEVQKAYRYWIEKDGEEKGKEIFEKMIEEGKLYKIIEQKETKTLNTNSNTEQRTSETIITSINVPSTKDSDLIGPTAYTYPLFVFSIILIATMVHMVLNFIRVHAHFLLKRIVVRLETSMFGLFLYTELLPRGKESSGSSTNRSDNSKSNNSLNSSDSDVNANDNSSSDSLNYYNAVGEIVHFSEWFEDLSLTSMGLIRAPISVAIILYQLNYSDENLSDVKLIDKILAPMIGLVSYYLFAAVMFPLVDKRRERFADTRNECLNLTVEALENIKGLKVFSNIDRRFLEKRILKTKLEEMKHRRTMEIFRRICIGIDETFPFIIMCLLAYNAKLNFSKLFPLYQALKNLVSDATRISDAVFAFLAVRVSYKRINQYVMHNLRSRGVLDLGKLKSLNGSPNYSNAGKLMQRTINQGKESPFVEIPEKAVFSFPGTNCSKSKAAAESENSNSNSGSESDTGFHLQFASNFEIQAGDICLLSGPMGTGKTATVLALLNEMKQDQDNIMEGNSKSSGKSKSNTSLSTHSQLKYAYAPERSTLLSTNIRNNILMGLPYRSKLYKRVVKMSEFDELLDSNVFPYRDMTEVITSGCENLSGGQKQRVSIARAIYRMLYFCETQSMSSESKTSNNQNTKVFLIFDNTLSALDERTALKIVANLRWFLRSPERSAKVAVLVTRQTSGEADSLDSGNQPLACTKTRSNSNASEKSKNSKTSNSEDNVNHDTITVASDDVRSSFLTEFCTRHFELRKVPTTAGAFALKEVTTPQAHDRAIKAVKNARKPTDFDLLGDPNGVSSTVIQLGDLSENQVKKKNLLKKSKSDDTVNQANNEDNHISDADTVGGNGQGTATKLPDYTKANNGRRDSYGDTDNEEMDYDDDDDDNSDDLNDEFSIQAMHARFSLNSIDNSALVQVEDRNIAHHTRHQHGKNLKSNQHHDTLSSAAGESATDQGDQVFSSNNIQEESSSKGTVSLRVFFRQLTLYTSLGLTFLIIAHFMLALLGFNINGNISNLFKDLERTGDPTLPNSKSNATLNPIWYIAFMPTEPSQFFNRYSMLTMLFGLTTVLKYAILVGCGYVGTKTLNTKIYRNIFLKKKLIGFFDQQPMGRFLNRFGTDVGHGLYKILYDGNGMRYIDICIQVTAFFITTFGLSAASRPDDGSDINWFTEVGKRVLIVVGCLVGVTVPIGIVYLILVRAFRSACRETQRFTMQQRSVRDAQLSDAVNSLTLLRAHDAVPSFFKNALNETALFTSGNFLCEAVDSHLKFYLVPLASFIFFAVQILSLFVMKGGGFRGPMCLSDKDLSNDGADGVGLLLNLNELIDEQFFGYEGFFRKLPEYEKLLIIMERLCEYGEEDEEEEEEVKSIINVEMTKPNNKSSSNSNSDSKNTSSGKLDLLPLPDLVDDIPVENALLNRQKDDVILRLRDIVVRYDTGFCAIKGVSLDIRRGERVFLQGRTGSGKSSLFLALLQLVDLESGTVELYDDPKKKLPTLINYPKKGSEGEKMLRRRSWAGSASVSKVEKNTANVSDTEATEDEIVREPLMSKNKRKSTMTSYRTLNNPTVRGNTNAKSSTNTPIRLTSEDVRKHVITAFPQQPLVFNGTFFYNVCRNFDQASLSEKKHQAFPALRKVFGRLATTLILQEELHNFDKETRNEVEKMKRVQDVFNVRNDLQKREECVLSDKVLYQFFDGTLKASESLKKQMSNVLDLLSQSQRQMLHVARVLSEQGTVKNSTTSNTKIPEIFLLDEVTSTLAEDEACWLMEQLLSSDVLKGKTVVCISHQAFLIKYFDTVVDLAAGRVMSVERGLLKKKE